MNTRNKRARNALLLGAAMTLGLFAFTLAPAEAEAAPCTGTYCKSVIKRLYVASGVVYVAPKDGGVENLICTPKSGVYLTLKNDHRNYKEIYAALLSATIAKREISLRIVDDSIGCRIAYITIDN